MLMDNANLRWSKGRKIGNKRRRRRSRGSSGRRLDKTTTTFIPEPKFSQCIFLVASLVVVMVMMMGLCSRVGAVVVEGRTMMDIKKSGDVYVGWVLVLLVEQIGDTFLGIGVECIVQRCPALCILKA